MLENNLFKKVMYFFLLVNLIPCFVLASENKVTLEVSNGVKIHNVKVLKKLPDQKYFKILEWDIGKSKLSDIQSKLGGIISHIGEAAYSTYSLCYTGNDGSILTFESSEIGGPEHVITSVSLEDTDSFKPKYKKNCEKSEKVSKFLKFGDMSFLHGTHSEMKSRFKKPSKEQKDLAIYYFKETITENLVEWDVSAIFEISSKNNKINKFVITKLKTN